MSGQGADNSELRLFIAETLRAIVAGVSDAKAGVRQLAEKQSQHVYTPPTAVDFDIAVSAEDSGSVTGGLKLQVFGIGTRAGGEVAAKNATVSRISFSVPLSYLDDSSSNASYNRYHELG